MERAINFLLLQYCNQRKLALLNSFKFFKLIMYSYNVLNTSDRMVQHNGTQQPARRGARRLGRT